MTTKDKTGTAFPIKIVVDDGIEHHLGLSKLDWFAGMALQGLLANPNRQAVGEGASKMYAITALTIADAMIAERNKTKEDANG